MTVRPLEASDESWMRAALEGVWGSTVVARLGVPIDAATLPALVARDATGAPVGLLTYEIRADALEVVTIQVEREGVGIGRALMDEVRRVATRHGVTRVWLVTTDDNTRAHDFYRRWGMALVTVHRDGVARSRTVKLSIPMANARGVLIRDELEFELREVPSED